MNSVAQSILGGLTAVVLAIAPFSTTTPSPGVPAASFAPQVTADAPTTYAVQAKSALIIDRATGRAIYAKNTSQALPMASLTKLMTAYLIIRSHTGNEKVIIPPDVKAVAAGGSVVIGLKPGDSATVDQLMLALLLPSANDAAVSLAVHDAGSVPAFVDKMNATAKELGLTNTAFKNPTGLDATGHVTNADDLARLTSLVLESPRITQVVKLSRGGFTSGQGVPYAFISTNELLNKPGVVGVKTGYTQAAGECLITLTRKDGREVLTVILGSPDRFAESRSMIDLALGLAYE